MQLCIKKHNSYLKKQIRGAKDRKAQIPCRARVRPCIQREPGHRPASGAALAGCRMTQREAACALTAGVVVTHPAKIQVMKIWRGREAERHCQKTLIRSSLTSLSCLSLCALSPLLSRVHLVHWHSFALVSALTHAAEISISWCCCCCCNPCAFVMCVCVCVCKTGRSSERARERRSERAWAGGEMREWIWETGEREKEGKEEEGWGLGKSPESLSCFSGKDPLSCPPQAVDTELLHKKKSFRRLQTGKMMWNNKTFCFNWVSPAPCYCHTSYTLFMRELEATKLRKDKEEALQLH